MNTFSLSFSDSDFVTFPFFYGGKVLKEGPSCGMSVKKAGSMRFRWNEENPLRKDFLLRLCKKNGLFPLSLELIHSKTVYDVKSKEDTKGLQGDGMITKNKSLLPVVTVADCMPLYFYAPDSGLFGVAHSGWKGTGIAGEVLNLAFKNYGVAANDFSVVIGPHIKDCCYIVNSQRAEYFSKNFGSDCLKPLEEGGVCKAGGRGLSVKWDNGSGSLYRLSLEKANLNLLEKLGVLEENIAVSKDCTCCNENLGSNRRETADYLLKNPASSQDSLSRCFTVQAAFVGNF